MQINNHANRLVLTFSASILMAGAAMASYSPLVSADNGDSNENGTYKAVLRPQNRSGVDGHATLVLKDTKLSVTINADGTVPYMVHPQHIHGQLNNTNASCPTTASDANNDSFVSVVEGAPKYGPIKINLTKPQTAFGPNDTKLFGASIFAPFAGIPEVSNFPKADGTGDLHFRQTYTFDRDNPLANDAFDSTLPLTKQHVVLHGGRAPASVDTEGGSTQGLVYDALLPVACGEIVKVRNSTSQGSKYDTSRLSNHSRHMSH